MRLQEEMVIELFLPETYSSQHLSGLVPLEFWAETLKLACQYQFGMEAAHIERSCCPLAWLVIVGISLLACSF